MMEKSYEPYHEDVLFKQKWERDDQFEDRGSYNKTSVEKPKYNEFGECFHLMLGFFFFFGRCLFLSNSLFPQGEHKSITY